MRPSTVEHSVRASTPPADVPGTTPRPAWWLKFLAIATFVAALLVGITPWHAFALVPWEPGPSLPEPGALMDRYVRPGLLLALCPAGVVVAAVCTVVALRRTRSVSLAMVSVAAVIAATHLGFTLLWTLEAGRTIVAQVEVQTEAPQAEPSAPPAQTYWPGEEPLDEPGAVTSLSADQLRAGVLDLRDATVATMESPVPNLMVGPLDAEPVEIACVPGGETGDYPDETTSRGVAYEVQLSVSGPDTVTDEQNIIELWKARGLTYDRAMGTNYAGGSTAQAIDQVRMRGDAQGWLNITVTSHCSPSD
ncbi:hypothetical protein [Pseudoclavibacter sp. AY1H1]|uniref:hypothetical protein n=1 Tax=Pseudoclavibacter sp. AY1H1 TaxID=2080584 RepID=UPI0011B05660|nr:hypothetical protein [Pseudoclavibacter sp. AY1H1]